MTVSSFSRGCKHNDRIKLISTMIKLLEDTMNRKVMSRIIRSKQLWAWQKYVLGYAKQDPTTCYPTTESLEVRSSSLPRFSTLAGELFVCDFWSFSALLLLWCLSTGAFAGFDFRIKSNKPSSVKNGTLQISVSTYKNNKIKQIRNILFHEK